MKQTAKLLSAIILFPILLSCNKNIPTIQTGGREVIIYRVLPFHITDVRLLDGPFKKATDLNKISLLKYEPDRLLAKFRKEAGLKPKAENYYGWENEMLAGHSLGHYLSACALMYQTSGDSSFLRRVDYIVDELAICQDSAGTGYLGAFTNGRKIFEEQVANGDIRAKGFDLNGIWSPFYTMHKIFAGLRDVYRLCGNQKALEIEKKFGDWVGNIVSNLSEEQVQNMLNCEHGGMNEVLADLYADTGNKKYLDLSRTFYHKAVLVPLSGGKDILPGKHGNTQIPKLIGLARLYELTGDETDRKAAEFFWERVVHHHSYVTGGHGNHEYFGPPDTLRNRLSNETTETCNVYNMLKLTEHLFEWNPDASLADFYERALLNHIHSSQNPVDGRVIYNLSLEMGGHKTWQNPFDFTCCVGTGMENHSKYGGSIFYHNNKELYVSQFIASELNWREKNLLIRQETGFPEEQETRLTFHCPKPVRLTVQVRFPFWAVKGMEITVNGKPVKITQKPGSFIPLERTWKDGDKAVIRFPFSLRLESMPDDTLRAAVLYGPLVFAGELGPQEDPASADPLYVPVIMAPDRNPGSWLTPVSGKTNTFLSNGSGRPHDVIFIPFSNILDQNYSVYFDLFDEQRWEKLNREYQAEIEKKKALEARTIDFFQPGEMQPEREHKFKSEKSWPGELKHKKYREADRGGWFSAEMKVNKNQPCTLAVKYWGGFPGSRTFDILVDGKLLATENISNKKPGQFFDVMYQIPYQLIQNKNKITVKFVPHDGHRAGPVFGLRTIINQ